MRGVGLLALESLYQNILSQATLQNRPHFDPYPLQRVINGFRLFPQNRGDLPVILSFQIKPEHLSFQRTQGIFDPLLERSGVFLLQINIFRALRSSKRPIALIFLQLTQGNGAVQRVVLFPPGGLYRRVHLTADQHGGKR